ncbi:hypothetical protein TIFTF001_055565, partial [Ficus carica]
MDSLLSYIFYVIILWILIQSLFRSFGRSRKLFPPGPNPLPVVGNLFALGDKPHRSLTKLSQIYGPLMSLKLGRITTVVISSSAMAKQVFQTHEQLFSNRPIPDAANADKHSESGMPWLPVSSMWKNLRKISNSHLFSAKALDASINLRQEKVLDLLNHVHKSAEAGEAVEIGRAGFKTVLNLLSTTFFDVDLADSSSDTARELKDAVWNLMEEMGKPNVADYFPLLRKIDPQGRKRRATINIRKFTDLLDLIINPRLGLKEVSPTTSPTE